MTYIDAMLEELQQRWHCRRLHGTDQAIHNFLVYTGRFISTGVLHSADLHTVLVYTGKIDRTASSCFAGLDAVFVSSALATHRLRCACHAVSLAVLSDLDVNPGGKDVYYLTY